MSIESNKTVGALGWMIECTLAPVANLSMRAKPPVGELRRQIGIAQAGVDFIRFNLEKADEEEACKHGNRFGRNTRLAEVLEQGGEVGAWALMKAK